MDDGVVDLYYEEIGAGKPVVLIHGFPLDHTTWLPVSNLLATKARCVLPDVRGLGRSPVTGIETSISSMGDDIVRLLDRLSIEKAVIVGHSMGGYICMEIVHNHPDRVSGLGLVATRASADTPEKAAGRLSDRQEVLKNGPAKLIDTMASRLTEDPEIRDQLLEIMKKNSPEGIAMALYAMAHRMDATEYLEALSIPVAMVIGIKDVFSPPDFFKTLSKWVKNGHIFSSPTGTHMILMEEPGLVARALEDTFLS